MRTKRDLSNISYNSPAYLEATLTRMKYEGIIDFWIFIEHLPELDEDHLANKKKHIHLMFRPSKMIQTAIIEKYFFEDDPNNEKPLKCTADWRIVNSFGDWWLYILHDIQYLKHKHLERQYHYNINDVHCSDEDTLERLISFIDFGDLYRIERIAEAARRGIPYMKAMSMGLFGEHPQRYALMYKAILSDVLAEQIQKNNSAENNKKDA